MKKLVKKIRKKMVSGHDDFLRYYCIPKKEWDKIVKEVEDGN